MFSKNKVVIEHSVNSLVNYYFNNNQWDKIRQLTTSNERYVSDNSVERLKYCLFPFSMKNRPDAENIDKLNQFKQSLPERKSRKIAKILQEIEKELL